MSKWYQQEAAAVTRALGTDPVGGLDKPKPFANKWLNRAILWELVLLVLIVYLPFMHRALGTFSPTGMDWTIIATVALTICPVLELAKVMERRGWILSSAPSMRCSAHCGLKR